VWDAATGAPTWDLEGHTDAIVSVEFSADGRRLVTGSNDRTTKIWDVNTGARLQDLDGPELWSRFAHFSRDGTRIVTTCGGVLYIWDVKTKERCSPEPLHDEEFEWAAYFADDSKVLALRKGQFEVVDGRTARQVSHGPPGASRFSCCTLGPDGNSVICGYEEGSLRVIDPSTWKVSSQRREHSTYVTEVLFNLGGDCLASVSRDFTIRIWDWPSLRVRAVLRGFATVPGSVRLSGDGRRLVAVNQGVASVWEANTGEELATLRRNEAEVQCAETSHDGRRVYLGFADGLVRMWTVPDDALAEAKKRKPRELTAEERARFGLVNDDRP
jgi:WD40 repeat protein